MTVAETINQKVNHLPVRAQEEVLEAVEQIEERYSELANNGNSTKENRHVLDLLAEIRIDGPVDLAERHNFYAHGKLEE